MQVAGNKSTFFSVGLMTCSGINGRHFRLGDCISLSLVVETEKKFVTTFCQQIRFVFLVQWANVVTVEDNLTSRACLSSHVKSKP